MNKIRLEYKFTAIYLVIGFFWIAFSDGFLNSVISDPDILTRAQTYKGWFYVSASALLFYFYLRRHLVRQRKAEQKAIESDRLKTAFLQNISHEIRTPMNGIIGFASLLDDKHLDDETKKQYLSIITGSSNRLLDIVNEMLDISMIETGNLKVQQQVVDINRLLDESFETFRFQVHPEVTLSYMKELAGEDGVIITDGTRVGQVLNNLLSNAVKFTERGNITFGYTLKDDQLDFYVQDSGIGIPADMHEVIFERFRKAEAGQSKFYDGVGLGLAICLGNLRLLGGGISVDSEPGKGSVFRFTIPYVKAEKTSDERRSDTAAMIPGQSGSVILVAEDEPTNLKYIREILSGTGVEIIHAADGLKAVEICRNRPEINLVLMDLKMPLCDGYEAAGRIRSFRPDLPVIAQTAYAMPEERDKAMASGFAGYLSKPFLKKELLAIIRKHNR